MSRPSPIIAWTKNCALAALAGCFLLLGFTDAAQPDEGYYEETVTIEREFTPGGSFNLSNHNGRIQVTSWDGDGVRIVAEKGMRVQRRSRLDSDEEIRDYFEQIRVKVGGDADDLVVKTIRPRSRGHVSTWIHYNVQLPRRADLIIASHNGHLSVEAIEGEARLTTHNGRVDVEDLDGNAVIETHNGSIDCDAISGNVRVQTHNGRIECDDVMGGVTSTAHNGRIECEDALGGVTATTHNGSIRIAQSESLQPGAKISCRTNNGSIALSLNQESSFDLDAKSQRGRVSTDFNVSRTSDQTPHSLIGEVKGGGAQVKLRTGNGSIKIHKS